VILDNQPFLENKAAATRAGRRGHRSRAAPCPRQRLAAAPPRSLISAAASCVVCLARRTLLAMTAAVITLVPTSLVSHAAGSQSGHFIMEMDRDRDGTVSRAEFLHYSSRTFKRLDASRTFNRLDRNHNGSLDPDELRSWSRHGSRKPSTQRR
jgi:hypothetical protein